MTKSLIVAMSLLIGLHFATILPSVFLSQIGYVHHFERSRLYATTKAGSAVKKICDNEKIQEVLEPASGRSGSVLIDCDLNLTRNSGPVTKRLLFEGRSSYGVTVDCNGATLGPGPGRIIEIRSQRTRARTGETHDDPVTGRTKWERPSRITIRNCNMIGAVRIWGMSETGEGYESTLGGTNYLKQSSRTADHVRRVRDNAPTDIVFDHVVISTVDRIPLYISPGVTNFQLLNSEIKSRSSGLAIYLDAESSENTFRNNKISTTTGDRELIAIDGSSHNAFINNWLSGLRNGGIYLYRNCGQNGVSRHSTPSHNVIVNNFFVYDKYSGFNPAVYLGARNGNRNYCWRDMDSHYGSGPSDLDSARFNIVMQNQIQKRSHEDMIRTAMPANSLPINPFQPWIRANSPNYIDHNETVAEQKMRRAGCYVVVEQKFLLDGESVRGVRTLRGQSFSYSCSDGTLTRSPA